MEVNILPITSRKTGRRIYPNEVLIPVGTGGLELELQESIIDALCFQLGIVR